MKKLREITRSFSRSEGLPIEARRLNTVLLCAMVTAGIGILTRGLIGWELIPSLLMLAMIVIVMFAYIIYHAYRIYNIGTFITVIMVSYIMLPVIFFSLGGMNSASGGYLLLGFVIIFMLIRGRLLIPFSALHFVVICVCYYLDYLYADLFVSFAGGYEHLESIRFLDAIHNITTIGVFVCSVILLQYRLYEKELKKTIAASRAKSEFLAKVSHEIRTPMNAILGMTELAAREDIPLVVQDHLFTVKQAGRNLLSIINDILDFSKIEAGKMELAPEEYMLSSVINDVINIIKIKVYDSRLRFIVNVDCHIPNILYGDASKIRQIMLNILGNSVKYTEEGYISLTVRGNIADEGNIDVIIEIADSGIGIKEDDLGKLYDTFTQLNTQDNFGVEGTGLGLAITHSFVTSMGGRIDVASEYGKGSVFTVTIPQVVRENRVLTEVIDPDSKYALVFERRQRCRESVVRAMECLHVRYQIASTTAEFFEKLRMGGFTHVFLASISYTDVMAEFPHNSSDAKFVLISEFGEPIPHRDVSIITTPIYCIPVANFLNGLSGTSTRDINQSSAVKFVAPDARVLVVDDIRTNVAVVKGLLLPYDMKVDMCLNGFEAVEAVKKHRYDLVLMDHMMPVMDGIEATFRIRELARDGNRYFSELPIIALTANAVVGMKEMFLRRGFNDFISKPIDTGKLNSALEKWIPREKQKRNTEMRQSSVVDAADPIFDISIDGLDTAIGVSNSGGTKRGYLKLLGVFYNDGLEKSADICACLKSDNISLLTTHVHALKNACGIIGAVRLSEAAREMEEAGSLGSREYIRQNCPGFLVELENLLVDIKRVLSVHESETRDSYVETGTLKALLERYKEALTDLDTKTLKEISGQLQYISTDVNTNDSIKYILHNKLIGEYDGAVALVDSLLLRLGERV